MNAAENRRECDSANSAPKADALPDCATPRHAESLSLGRFPASMENRARYITERLVSFRYVRSYGIVPNAVLPLSGGAR